MNSKKNYQNYEYGEAYLKWKSWDGDKFGAIKKSEISYYSAEIQRTNRSYSSQSKVLEIGFGNGSFLAYAKNNNWDIIGIEANKDLVCIASRCGFNVNHADSIEKFSDDSFDLIVAFDVLEHIQQDQLISFFQELARILKDGGCFVARFPNGDSPFGLLYQNGDITHVSTIGSRKVAYLGAQSKMDIIYIGGEAKPFKGVGFKIFIHRIISVPLINIFNIIINLIIFPRDKSAFFSSNLTAIFKVKK